MLLTLVVSVPLLAVADSLHPGNPKLCTIFTMVRENQVYFAGNEDYRNTDLIVVFEPPSGSTFGSVRLGYREGAGQQLAVAMNDQGLAWDINSIPESPLDPHPERPFSGWSDFLSAITKCASTVEEVAQLAGQYDFSSSTLEFVQLHVADATGDAAVLSPGVDGEVAITRKEPGDGHLVSTNFNRAIPDSANHPETYLRYDNTVDMLEGLQSEQEVSPEYLGSILEASHFESLSTYTLFSYVFDARNRIAYVYYMSDYDEAVKLDLSQELLGNRRTISLTDLVSQQTQRQALSKYRMAVIRDAMLLAITLISAAVLLTGLVRLLRHYLKRRDPGRTAVDTRRSRWFVTSIGLAWACCFWAVLLLLSHAYPPGMVSLRQPPSLYSTSLILLVIGIPGIMMAIPGLIRSMKGGTGLRLGRFGGIGFARVSVSALQVIASAYLVSGLVDLFMQYWRA